jgi:anti-sigma regulatory factor (Ser/Thr protein kinase)
MTSATHDLSCHIGAPSAARRWTADCLRAHLGETFADFPDLIDDAVLCVSELVTNAVHAGCTMLQVELSFLEARLRIGVVDDAPGRPAARQAGIGDHSGRGLALVEAVSRRWGVDPVDRGKIVWAEFAAP